jgi:hypothetical protein
MADFSVNPVATQIKPPEGVSIGDMLNLARGAQAYRQAEVMNPLQAQAQQQLVEQGGINLSTEIQKNKERQAKQQFFSNPENWQTNGRIDMDKLNTQLPSIAPLTHQEDLSKYSILGKAQTDSISAKQKLTQDQRAIIAQRYSILGRMGIQDKNVYLKEMDLLKQENPDNVDLHRLIDADKTIWGEIQSGPHLPEAAIKGAQQLLTPETQETRFAPTVQTTTDGRTVTTQPSVGGRAPTATVGVLGGMQQNVPNPNAPSTGMPTAGTQVAPGMTLPYAVRRADQPYIKEPSEEKDATAGADYRNNLVNAQIGLPQARRNTEEVMRSAEEISKQLFDIEKQGGFPGNVGRKIRSAIGSDKYDLLAKDLAQQAITQSKTMGSLGVTVGGLDMNAVANGTVTIPPDVLVTIAKRIEADRTNMDMQANGSQKFFEKFGDNNQKAFIQAWNANAKDTRIFEAINVLKNETDPKKMENEFTKLFPKKSEYEDALLRYQNLKSLEETGVPIKPLKPLKR